MSSARAQGVTSLAANRGAARPRSPRFRRPVTGLVLPPAAGPLDDLPRVSQVAIPHPAATFDHRHLALAGRSSGHALTPPPLALDPALICRRAPSASRDARLNEIRLSDVYRSSG